jgi:hypothetical protein
VGEGPHELKLGQAENKEERARERWKRTQKVKGEQRGERAVFVDVGESSRVAHAAPCPMERPLNPGADTATEIIRMCVT